MAVLPIVLLVQLAAPAMPVAAPAPDAAPSPPALPAAPRDGSATTTTLPATPPTTTEDCHCGVPNSPRGPR